ncbi:hypothetical protein [Dielma fastidiosa]|uniref:hypothetical protein n=1 Tax=Dielma fastidiosa TaxID=1034346 RepID=UPI000ED523C3|nr:hypothetical protein [Dielma fastidiosa]HAH94903.1 hypothetical protein [Dielma fastidiosa]
MKKCICLSMLILCCACSNQSKETDQGTSQPQTYVDSYTSASPTRSQLSGDDLKTVQTELVSLSSDLASIAQAAAEGYSEPEGAVIAQIMSVNPDGTPGLSTIHAWQYNADSNTVTVELTYGQNALNLSTVNSRGTLLVHGKAYYILHLETASVEELKYSDENYEKGLFNAAYSGKDAQLSEYSITFKVLSIESSMVYMFQ